MNLISFRSTRVTYLHRYMMMITRATSISSRSTKPAAIPITVSVWTISFAFINVICTVITTTLIIGPTMQTSSNAIPGANASIDPKQHLDRFSRFAGLTDVANGHEETHRPRHVKTSVAKNLHLCYAWLPAMGLQSNEAVTVRFLWLSWTIDSS